MQAHIPGALQYHLLHLSQCQLPRSHPSHPCRATPQCNLLVGLVLLPVTKHSLLAGMHGTAWEKLHGYHRWLGTYFLMCIFTHDPCVESSCPEASADSPPALPASTRSSSGRPPASASLGR